MIPEAIASMGLALVVLSMLCLAIGGYSKERSAREDAEERLRRAKRELRDRECVIANLRASLSRFATCEVRPIVPSDDARRELQDWNRAGRSADKPGNSVDGLPTLRSMPRPVLDASVGPSRKGVRADRRVSERTCRAD